MSGQTDQLMKSVDLLVEANSIMRLICYVVDHAEFYDHHVRAEMLGATARSSAAAYRLSEMAIELTLDVRESLDNVA